MPIVNQGTIVDTSVPEYERLLKHVRRPDLYRLLKHLKYHVTPDMPATQLRELVKAHQIPIFQYMSKRLLRFNPQSEAVMEATRRYRSEEGAAPEFEVAPEVPGFPRDVPIVTPDVKKRPPEEVDKLVGNIKPELPQMPPMTPETVESKKNEVMTPLGFVNLEDLSQPALFRLAQERGHPVKAPISKTKLLTILGG